MRQTQVYHIQLGQEMKHTGLMSRSLRYFVDKLTINSVKTMLLKLHAGCVTSTTHMNK